MTKQEALPPSCTSLKFCIFLEYRIFVILHPTDYLVSLLCYLTQTSGLPRCLVFVSNPESYSETKQKFQKFRSSHRKCSVKTRCSQKFRKFYRKIPALESLLQLIKKRLQHKCFHFAKFLKTPILKNICDRVLVEVIVRSHFLRSTYGNFHNLKSNQFFKVCLVWIRPCITNPKTWKLSSNFTQLIYFNGQCGLNVSGWSKLDQMELLMSWSKVSAVQINFGFNMSVLAQISLHEMLSSMDFAFWALTSKSKTHETEYLIQRDYIHQLNQFQPFFIFVLKSGKVESLL